MKDEDVYPRKPKVGDKMTVTRKGSCGCIFDILCSWDGQMWAYLTSPHCEPHGSYGMTLISATPEGGAPATPESTAKLQSSCNHEGRQHPLNGHYRHMSTLWKGMARQEAAALGGCVYLQCVDCGIIQPNTKPNV